MILPVKELPHLKHHRLPLRAFPRLNRIQIHRLKKLAPVPKKNQMIPSALPRNSRIKEPLLCKPMAIALSPTTKAMIKMIREFRLYLRTK